MTTTPKTLTPRDRDYLDGKLGGAPIGPHVLETAADGTKQAKFGEMVATLINIARRSVVATVAATGGSGGATAGTLTVAVTDLEGNTVDEAKQLLVVGVADQYDPDTPDATVTFSAATVGTLVDSGNGWALIETDATGNFACTVSNSADETIYFSAEAPKRGAEDTSLACVNVVSNSDDATWAA